MAPTKNSWFLEALPQGPREKSPIRGLAADSTARRVVSIPAADKVTGTDPVPGLTIRVSLLAEVPSAGQRDYREARARNLSREGG